MSDRASAERPAGRGRKIAIVIIVALLAGVAGYALRGSGGHDGHDHDAHAEAEAGAGQVELWICPMNISHHPYYSSPVFSKCGYCGMDLVPATVDSAEGPRDISFSEYAVALMDVETSAVERRYVNRTLRLVGKVDYDETRLASVTARVGGRLDKLHVNFTGVFVRAGEPVAEIYSPALISAQEELLQSLRTLRAGGGEMDILRGSAESTAEAARDRLRLWGLSAEQIAAIEESGRVSDHVTVNSPVSGIVVNKSAVEGTYVETGEAIYEVADLSRVWVRLDAYEVDVGQLRLGQEVEFTTVSYPGERFGGRISFIDPVLDERTRTVRVRVEAANEDGRLRPGMFVRSAVEVVLGEGGSVVDADEEERVGAGLVIPASAALVTGRRAVVYVQRPGTERATFEGREVELGPRADEYYLVAGGLAEGERVVTRGSFKIDSEMQIRAKPSMMSPEGAAPAGHGHAGHGGHSAAGAGAGAEAVEARGELSEEFRERLEPVLGAYFAVSEALASDDMDAAKSAAERLAEAVSQVPMAGLGDEDHEQWMRYAQTLQNSGEAIGEAASISQARAAFEELSRGMIAVARWGRPIGAGAVYVINCPMAFDNRGADWLQGDREVRNPYFGSAMFRCGGVMEVIQPGGAAGELSHE